MVITEQNANELIKKYENELKNSAIIEDILDILNSGVSLFKTNENGDIWFEADNEQNVRIEISEKLENKLIEKNYSEEEIEKAMNYLVAAMVLQISKLSENKK